MQHSNKKKVCREANMRKAGMLSHAQSCEQKKTAFATKENSLNDNFFGPPCTIK